MIAVTGIAIISQRHVRIHPENENVTFFLESLINRQDDESKNEVIKFKLKDKGADVEILSPTPGIYKVKTQNSKIIAVDPLVWILDDNQLPLKSLDFRLQEFGAVALSLWQNEGYPILIPGDIPDLILPILIKLQEDITEEPPLNVLKNYNDFLLTTRELRSCNLFNEAFALLDNWVDIGALSPQWEDFDETAFLKAVNNRNSAAFLQNLSWKRMQSKDISFFWTVLPIIPGEGISSYSITGKALELTIHSRKAVEEELQIIREKMKSTEASASLMEYTGYVPTTWTGPFMNKEDRDSRSALQGAADWIIYP